MWYTRKNTVTHPSTNWAQRRVTWFMRRTTLPLRQAAKEAVETYVEAAVFRRWSFRRRSRHTVDTIGNLWSAHVS